MALLVMERRRAVYKSHNHHFRDDRQQRRKLHRWHMVLDGGDRRQLEATALSGNATRQCFTRPQRSGSVVPVPSFARTGSSPSIRRTVGWPVSGSVLFECIDHISAHISGASQVHSQANARIHRRNIDGTQRDTAAASTALQEPVALVDCPGGAFPSRAATPAPVPGSALIHRAILCMGDYLLTCAATQGVAQSRQCWVNIS